jgi:hypothetical protein
LRNRLLIVVLGISLGLAARFAVDFYQARQKSPPSEPAPPAAKSSPAEESTEAAPQQ